MEALESRSDAQLAQRAIRKGWGFSEDEKKEIKNVALGLVRHKSAKAQARGVALCVAMEAQDIKLEKMAQEADRPTVPTVVVQNNHISVAPDVIANVLARRQKKQDVIENQPTPVPDRSSIAEVTQAPRIVTDSL